MLPTALFSEVCDHAFELRDQLLARGIDATKASFWFAKGSEPRNPLERAIAHYMHHVEPGPTWIGSEYWLYFSDGERVFHPHFDKDETRWEVAREVCIPLHTSVLYLTSTGAPTVAFDVTPEQLQRDHSCWLTAENVAIWPAANRLLSMSGLTYHGVIPPKDMDAADRRGRATLMAASWARKPAAPGCEEPTESLLESLLKRAHKGEP
jgi:hypothetical protein